MPWNGRIDERLECRAEYLARFLSQEWLARTHIDLIGQFIQADAPKGFRYENVDFCQYLI